MNLIFTVLGGIVIFSGKIILFASAPTALVVAALKAYTDYIVGASVVSVVMTFVGWWVAIGAIMGIIGLFCFILGYLTLPKSVLDGIK